MSVVIDVAYKSNNKINNILIQSFSFMELIFEQNVRIVK